MPAKTPEQLRQRTAALKKKLADKGASLEGAKVRALKKTIRRVQRKRRRLVASAARAAATGKKETTQ